MRIENLRCKGSSKGVEGTETYDFIFSHSVQDFK